MNAVDPDVNNTNRESSREEAPTGSGDPDEIPVTENTGPYADIQPPPKAKTKGSGVHDDAPKNAYKKKKGKESAPARPLPELDENGVPKGQRLCSSCNKIAGHNAKTCKKRQLAAQLLETHQKVYGASGTKKNVKVRIKNVLARRNVKGREDEEILDTDEDEDSEDNTYEDDEEDEEREEEEEEDDEDEDQEDNKENNEQAEQEDHTNATFADGLASMSGHETGNIELPEGQRICGICKKKEGHNARTCPHKDEIIAKQRQKDLDEASDNNNMIEPKGVRTCHTCGKIRGHNSRTCLRLQLAEKQRQQKLQLEEEERQQTLKLQSSADGPAGKQNTHTKQAKNTAGTPEPVEPVRRSRRLKNSAD